MNRYITLLIFLINLQSGLCQQEAGFFWNPNGDGGMTAEDLLCADPQDPSKVLVATGKLCDVPLTTKTDCNNKAIQMARFFSQAIYKLSEGPVEIPSNVSINYPKGCWIRLAGPNLDLNQTRVTVTTSIEIPEVEDEKAIDAITTATGATAALASIASGSLLSGGQGAKLKNFIKLTSCPPDTDSQDMDFLDSPTGLGRRTKGSLANHNVMERRRQMMLGNIATVSGILLCHILLVCVCYAYKRILSKPATFEKCLAIVRFPSFSIFPFLILFQPITTPAFTLLYHEHTLLDVVICTFAFVFVGFITYLMLRSTRDDVFPCDLEQDLTSRPWRLWFFGEFSWNSKDVDSDRYERRFSLIFKDFTATYKNFIVIDIVVLFVISMVSGLIPTTKLQCAGQAIVMTLSEIVFLAIIWKIQPFLAPFNHYHLVAVTVLQVLGLLCALGAILELHKQFAAASRVLLLASTAFITLKCLFDILVWLYNRFTAWRGRRRAKKSAQNMSISEPTSITTPLGDDRKVCESTYSNDDSPVGDFSGILSPKNNPFNAQFSDDGGATPLVHVMTPPAVSPRVSVNYNRSFGLPTAINSRRDTPKRPPSGFRAERPRRESLASVRVDRPRRESTARIDLDVQLLLQSANV